MKNERILSYKLSSQLKDDELAQVSAAGYTYYVSGGATYGPQGWDEPTMDVRID